MIDEQQHEDSEKRLREVEMRLATHEGVCAERYAGIQKDVATVSKGVDDLKKLITRVALGIGFGMASILASIAFKP
jgi:hypothetical protein